MQKLTHRRVPPLFTRGLSIQEGNKHLNEKFKKKPRVTEVCQMHQFSPISSSSPFGIRVF